MTTRFSSKEEALNRGLFYAGSKQQVSDLKVKETTKINFALETDPKQARPLDVYEIINEDGKPVEMGVEQSGNEYYLWLILENGMTWRV